MMYEYDQAVLRAIHQDRLDRASGLRRRNGTRNVLRRRRGR